MISQVLRNGVTVNWELRKSGLSGLGSIARRTQSKAVPDDPHNQAHRVADTSRYRDQTECRAEPEGRNFVRRRYHVEPKNEVNQPLCSADPDQSGPEGMPKTQEDGESKTERLWVDSIQFCHLSFLCSRCPLKSQTLQDHAVMPIT
jgi:hypothetical protein